MNPIFVFLLLVCVPRASVGVQTFPYVLTTTGAVRGNKETVLEREVHSYLGIPYAIPPVGDLRFRRPEPIHRWKGIYEASKNPNPCMQFRSIDVPWTLINDVSEDCLYLNVWSPQSFERKGTLKPIMVWIYGGGFYSGSSTYELYDGGVLASYGDVIVASMNYRVGVFGFFSGNVKEAPGNMGMMDQVLALRWIKDNARVFGGDPCQITIFGESAGAISIALHFLSPMSSGLFSRAIMQSSGGFFPFLGVANDHLQSVKADSFAKSLGCSTEERNLTTHPEHVISCLKTKDAIDLSREESVSVANTGLGFIPRYRNEFMPFNPLEKLRSGKVNCSNVLLGSNSNEGAVFVYVALSQVMTLKEPPKWSPEEGKSFIKALFHNSFSTTADNVAERYMKGIQDGDYVEVRQAVFNSLGDYLHVCPSMLFAESVAKVPNSNVYYLWFDHRPSVSPWPEWMRMSHFDDIQFYFGVPFRNSTSYTDEEKELSRYVMDIWTSFAKNGKPHLNGTKPWPKYTPESHKYLELNPKQYITGEGPHLEFCNFWRQYYV